MAALAVAWVVGACDGETSPAVEPDATSDPGQADVPVDAAAPDTETPDPDATVSDVGVDVPEPPEDTAVPDVTDDVPDPSVDAVKPDVGPDVPDPPLDVAQDTGPDTSVDAGASDVAVEDVGIEDAGGADTVSDGGAEDPGAGDAGGAGLPCEPGGADSSWTGEFEGQLEMEWDSNLVGDGPAMVNVVGDLGFDLACFEVGAVVGGKVDGTVMGTIKAGDMEFPVEGELEGSYVPEGNKFEADFFAPSDTIVIGSWSGTFTGEYTAEEGLSGTWVVEFTPAGSAPMLLGGSGEGLWIAAEKD